MKVFETGEELAADIKARADEAESRVEWLAKVRETAVEAVRAELISYPGAATDVLTVFEELDVAAARERLLLELLDVCYPPDGDPEVGSLGSDLRAAVAVGAVGALVSLAMAGAVLGAVRVTVGRYRRG